MSNNKIIAALAVIIIVGFGAYVATHPESFKIKNADAPADLSASATTSAETDQTGHVQTAPGDHPEVDHEANEGVASDQATGQTSAQSANQKSSISWQFAGAGESDGIAYTNVAIIINGKTYATGKFAGSCSVVGANGKAGIDGKGLLTGELSAAQCWFAGGGDEIGVFANEAGGFDIMTGQLGEGEEGSAFFRGNFKIKQTVRS